MKKLLLFIITVILFSSCKKEIDFSKIKKGMTKDQVIELVGEPKEKIDLIFGTMFLYETHGVSFLNDSVVRCKTKAEFAKEMEGNDINTQKIDSAVQVYKQKRAQQ